LYKLKKGEIGHELSDASAERKKEALKEVTNDKAQVSFNLDREQIGSVIRCNDDLLKKHRNLLVEFNLEDLVKILSRKTKFEGAAKSANAKDVMVKKESVVHEEEADASVVTIMSENDDKLTKDVVFVLRPLEPSKEQASAVDKEVESHAKLPSVSVSKNKRKPIEDGEIFSELEDGETEEMRANFACKKLKR
jgi:hypothetical protein